MASTQASTSGVGGRARRHSYDGPEGTHSGAGTSLPHTSSGSTVAWLTTPEASNRKFTRRSWRCPFPHASMSADRATIAETTSPRLGVRGSPVDDAAAAPPAGRSFVVPDVRVALREPPHAVAESSAATAITTQLFGRPHRFCMTRVCATSRSRFNPVDAPSVGRERRGAVQRTFAGRVQSSDRGAQARPRTMCWIRR